MGEVVCSQHAETIGVIIEMKGEIGQLTERLKNVQSNVDKLTDIAERNSKEIRMISESLEKIANNESFSSFLNEGWIELRKKIAWVFVLGMIFAFMYLFIKAEIAHFIK